MPILRLDDFARDQFKARLDRLASQISRAGSDPDADAVHDLRVAIRRFSQVLIVFESLLPRKKGAAARRKLRRLMKPAGDVRNLDVGTELIGPRAPSDLRAAFSAARSKSAERLRRRLDIAEQRRWTDGWTDHLIFLEASQPAAAFAGNLLPPMEANFRAHGETAAAPESGAASLHKFRIACKRLRYSLELFEPLDPPGFAPRIEAIRNAQQILGDVNDAAVTTELVVQFGGAPAIERRLAARYRRLAARFRREWPEIEAVAAPAGLPRGGIR